MNFKLILVIGFAAIANAGFLRNIQILQRPVQSIVTQEQPQKDNDFDPHPQYNFSYGVNDLTTGDNKSQNEARDGDLVRGQYSLIDSDGLKRVVDYTADSVNGFNAVVQRQSVPESERTVVLQKLQQQQQQLQPTLTSIRLQATPIRIATASTVPLLQESKIILTRNLGRSLRRGIITDSGDSIITLS